MVAYQGAKMSKSLGNLVFVSRLRAAGVDPMAIRLALIAHHYRSDWEWTDDVLAEAQARLDRWRAAVARTAQAGGGARRRVGVPAADAVLATVRERLADDLDAPGAVAAIDEWADAVLAGAGGAGRRRRPQDAALVRDTADALLGVALYARGRLPAHPPAPQAPPPPCGFLARYPQPLISASLPGRPPGPWVHDTQPPRGAARQPGTPGQARAARPAARVRRYGPRTRPAAASQPRPCRAPRVGGAPDASSRSCGSGSARRVPARGRPWPARVRAREQRRGGRHGVARPRGPGHAPL